MVDWCLEIVVPQTLGAVIDTHTILPNVINEPKGYIRIMCNHRQFLEGPEGHRPPIQK